MAGNGDGGDDDGVKRRSWQRSKGDGDGEGGGVNVDISSAIATASGTAKEGGEAADAGYKGKGEAGEEEEKGASEKKKEENVDMGNYIVCFAFSTKRYNSKANLCFIENSQIRRQV